MQWFIWRQSAVKPTNVPTTGCVFVRTEVFRKHTHEPPEAVQRYRDHSIDAPSFVRIWTIKCELRLVPLRCSFTDVYGRNTLLTKTNPVDRKPSGLNCCWHTAESCPSCNCPSGINNFQFKCWLNRGVTWTLSKGNRMKTQLAKLSCNRSCELQTAGPEESLVMTEMHIY